MCHVIVNEPLIIFILAKRGWSTIISGICQGLVYCTAPSYNVKAQSQHGCCGGLFSKHCIDGKVSGSGILLARYVAKNMLYSDNGMPVYNVSALVS